MQATAAIEYSWLPRDATPHNWTTEIISDLSLPITFVGLCTIDRRNIYPQKEVSTSMPADCHAIIHTLPTSVCQILHPIQFSCIADIIATTTYVQTSLQAVTR